MKLLSVFSPSAAHPSLSSVFQDHSKSSLCLQSNSTHCVSYHPHFCAQLPPLPPFKHVSIPLSLCIYQLSLSLSPPFFTAYILFYIASIFRNQYFSLFPIAIFKTCRKRRKKEKSQKNAVRCLGICWLLRIQTQSNRNISSVRGQRS